MARIIGDAILDSKFNQLVKAWPDTAFHLHRTIGKQGRKELRWGFLNGQEIKLRSNEDAPQDALGRFLVNSYASQKGVQLSSYPVNLFEKGRGLRDGSREAGKYIITRKLKGVVSSNLTAWIAKFEAITLQKEFDKA